MYVQPSIQHLFFHSSCSNIDSLSKKRRRRCSSSPSSSPSSSIQRRLSTSSYADSSDSEVDEEDKAAQNEMTLSYALSHASTKECELTDDFSMSRYLSDTFLKPLGFSSSPARSSYSCSRSISTPDARVQAPQEQTKKKIRKISRVP